MCLQKQNMHRAHPYFVTVFSRFTLMKSHSAIEKHNRKHLASTNRSSCFYYRSQEQDTESHLISVFVNVVVSEQMPYLRLRAEACRLMDQVFVNNFFVSSWVINSHFRHVADPS